MEMGRRAVVIAFWVALLHLHYSLSSSDPDPVQDFCIPETGHGPGKTARFIGSPCKNPSNSTAGDFVFIGIKSPGNFSTDTGFAGISVTPELFPGLHTLGMSFVRADLEPGGINSPHYHPRATEIALIVEGTVYSGFVDTGNRVFAKVIEKGEVMVFPRGLLHFQMNVGDSPATIYGSFNSENPGVVRIPTSVFGSEIKEELLEKAFGLSSEEIGSLRRRFGP